MLRWAARLTGKARELERITGSLEVDARHATDVLGWQARTGLPAAIAAMAHEYARERERHAP
jgi:UDP-glucose 4-epimerase